MWTRRIDVDSGDREARRIVQNAQGNSLRLLQWMMAASLALPLALFSVTAVIAWNSTRDDADRQNRSNTKGMSASLMPGPLSLTLTDACDEVTRM